MNSTFRNTASIIALVLLLMVSLYTLSDATSHSATFGKYYNWLLFFNAIGLVKRSVLALSLQVRQRTIDSWRGNK